jgi:hypothetical protein
MVIEDNGSQLRVELIVIDSFADVILYHRADCLPVNEKLFFQSFGNIIVCHTPGSPYHPGRSTSWAQAHVSGLTQLVSTAFEGVITTMKRNRAGDSIG